MAVTHHNLTAKFLDPEWNPFTASDGSIVAWIETNVGNTEGIVDTVANAIALGGLRKTVDSTGAVSWTNLVGSDSDAADIGLASGTLQYRVTAEYRNPVTRRRDRWVSGWFSLTADVDLADVIAEQYLPAEWVTGATAAIQAIIDDATANFDDLLNQGQALLDAQIALSGINDTDSAVAGLINDPLLGPLTRAALTASTADSIEPGETDPQAAVDARATARIVAEVKEKQGRNLLDFADSGTMADQSAAILAAFAAHPGDPFWLPDPGVLRCDSPLTVTTENPLIIDGRLYAAAAMDTLIDWDNGAATASDCTQDKYLVGRGEIDANLLADTAVAVGGVIRFPLGHGLTITDPVHRGLVTKAVGAEVYADDLRIHNTGTTNATDNVAIEAVMNDCTFSHIVTRDFTTGVWDKGANAWLDIHPWIGDLAQLTARYEDSIGFLIEGDSRLGLCYADTYRTMFKTASGAVLNIAQGRSYSAPGNLSDALAAAYPGTILDLGSGSSVRVTGTRFKGHPTTPHAFTAGDTSRLYVDRTSSAPVGVSGFGEYHRGVAFGKTTFTPNVFGSTTSGSQSYASRSGYMEVRDGMVTYTFTMNVTLGATIAGNLRFGGLPMVPGASSVNFGFGPIPNNSGVSTASCAVASGTTTPLTAMPLTDAGVEISASALAGTTLFVRASITCPFDYAA